MKNKIMGFSILIILMIAVIWVFKDKISNDQSRPDTEQMKSDRRTLVSAESTEVQTYEALARLSRLQDHAAHDVALKKASDPSRIVREGAANALGHYTSKESFLALSALLGDDDSNIRIRTLQALGNAYEDRRIELIHNFLKNQNISNKEKVVAHSILLKMAREDVEKKYSLDFFIDFIKSGDGADELMAFSKLAEILPNDAQVAQLIKAKIEKSNNPVMIAHGIRHLSALKDQWLNTKIEQYLNNSSEHIRSAAILSLHQLCPKNSWSILSSKFKSEKSEMVIDSIVREASSLGGEKAKEFFKSALASGYLRGAPLLRARELQKSLSATSITCPDL